MPSTSWRTFREIQRTRSYGTAGNIVRRCAGRSGLLHRAIRLASLLAGLAVISCLVPPAEAQRSRTAADKRRQADAYYRQAIEIQKTFEEIPFEKRAASDYQRVIRAFRLVYHTDPGYGNNTLSLMAIGALYEEMGLRWENAGALESAIEAYEFLVREYPGSKFRREASLAVARIYRDGLNRTDEAVSRYKRFLADFPRAPERAEAQKAMAEMEASRAAAAKSLEEEKTANPAKPVEANAAASPAEQPAAQPKPTRGLAVVSGVRHWVTPDYTRVVIDVGKDVKYGVGRVGNPPRVYVDLQGARPVAEISNQTFPVQDGLLKGVKTGRHSPNVTRVVLYVDDLTDYSVFELPNPYRVVVDIRNRSASAEAAAKTAASGASDAAKPAAAEAAVKTPSEAVVNKTERSKPAVVAADAEPVVEAAKAADAPVFEKVEAARPNRDGTRSLTRALGLKIGRILLDPGHGGSDVGTIGPTGLLEKELVLDVTKRLGKLIEEGLGSEVLYTRQDDSYVPLEARTALANQKEADLFLSIHANSSRSPSARGAETYYLNFTSDAEALEVAARENAISQERISQLQGLVEKIAMAEKVDESREFAEHVQSEVWKTQSVKSRRIADRGVKKAPFVVLIGANMPSVLAEIAFLSNPQEEKLLKTPEHRQKIAEALYDGIVGYVESLSVVKVAARHGE